MAKKIEINENWEPVEVEDLSNLFIVVFKHGSFDQGYVEAFDTDDILMQNAYDSLAKQYDDCGCDELTKIYLIKVPNTDQVNNMCNTALFNGSSCDPHVIEATRDLFNRADCEPISCWEGCGLTEAKKKKNKVCSSITFTTGDPALNMKHFNKCMGTDGLGNPADHPHLVIGDTLPNGPVASEVSGESSSEAAGDAGTAGGEGGAMGESLNEAKEESLEQKLRDILSLKEDEEPLETGRVHLTEFGDGENAWWNVKFDDDTIDFGTLKVYDRTPEELEDGRPVATFMISGGKNGSGNWLDYTKDIAEVFKTIKEKTGCSPLLYELKTDIADDLWDGLVFLYNHEDDVKESLTEDLIVIDEKNAREKLDEIKKQIEDAKDWKVRRNLLTLMNVYLFQTIYEADHQEETGCDINKEEWDEYSKWHTEQGEKLLDEHPEAAREEAKEEPKENAESDEEIEENLTEAHLDYHAQLDKMKQLEAGTRGFNAGSASLDKILFNYDICIQHNLLKARKAMEDALRLHGWDQYIKPTKKQVNIFDRKYTLVPGMFILDSAKIVWYGKANPQQLLNDYGNDLTDLLIILIFALSMKEANLAGAVKDYILKNFTVSLVDLKTFLNNCFSNAQLLMHINKLIHDCKESLVEDTSYAHKFEDNFEVPPQIKFLDQNKVEEFIKELAPEELFRVGYATPMYFYSELDDKFDLVKATEMEGYTGIDYRDAVADQTVADHNARIANAQRQIDAYQDGATGHSLNKDGERFSTSYRSTNKLALNPEKSNMQVLEYEYVLDANGNPVLDGAGNPIIKKDINGEYVVKSKIDMNKILFYPRVGSVPITHYYVDFHNGQGFKHVEREVLVNTLYKFIIELERARTNNVSKADLMWLQKKGYGDIKKDSIAVIKKFYDANPGNIPIWAYRKADEAGIAPEEYYKEHPYSTRWSMSDLKKKATYWVDADATTTLAQDAATVSGKELAAVKGMDREVKNSELKPQVRALYSNQVYWLDGRPGKLGGRLREDLQEDLAPYNPDRFEDIVLDSKVRDWYAGNCPHEYQLEKIPADLTWQKVIDAIEAGDFESLKLNLDTEPREAIWMRGCEIYYSKTGKLPEKDKDAQRYLSELLANAYNKVVDNIEAMRNIPDEAPEEIPAEEPVIEALDLKEAKRYVKRYYVRPLNIFCGNKEDIIQALIRAGDQNCSVYSLKRLDNHEDVHLLQPSDIIYYWDEHVLYDKNHVQVMDYDLFVKHEEDRKKVGNVDTMSDAAFGEIYDDRATEDDLKDKEVIANYKALNKISR